MPYESAAPMRPLEISRGLVSSDSDRACRSARIARSRDLARKTRRDGRGGRERTARRAREVARPYSRRKIPRRRAVPPLVSSSPVGGENRRFRRLQRRGGGWGGGGRHFASRPGTPARRCKTGDRSRRRAQVTGARCEAGIGGGRVGGAPAVSPRLRPSPQPSRSMSTLSWRTSRAPLGVASRSDTTRSCSTGRELDVALFLPRLLTTSFGS